MAFHRLTIAFGVIMALSVAVLAAPGNRRAKNIDEIFSEVIRQNRGLEKSRGRLRTTDNKVEILELDIAVPVPERGEGTRPHIGRVGRGGKGQGRGQGRGARRQKRNATKRPNSRWPNSRVYYTFDSGFTTAELAVFQEAIAAYNQYTCIQWIQRSSETNYVFIKKAGGCWSYVGMTGGRQDMSLATGCLYHKSTSIHEMMHAVGVYHEHTRPDQSQYVTINYPNIESDKTHNFVAKTSSQVDVYGTDYSYESVMHYGRKLFTVNGQDTITTLDTTKQDIIGRAPTFAFEDIELLNKMYSCAENCPPANCPSGSFQAHDCNCYCKTGDPNSPVANCGQVCLTPGQACGCSLRSDACSGISHSTCNTASEACECDSNYVSHEGSCQLITSITCTTLGVDCKCSLNTNPCATGIPNSECDTSTNACNCQSGFVPNANGGCTDINSVNCNLAGVPCYCDHKGTQACSSVSNSNCISSTGSCDCVEDYYTTPTGECNAAPACTTLNQACHCSVQGADACAAIDHTVCDSATDSCICNPLTHHLSNGVCVSSNSYISDGSSIAPFTISSISTVNFVPAQGTDSNLFEVGTNGWYLYAGSSTSGIAAIETAQLTGAGSWCVDIGVKLNNVIVISEYSTNNGQNWSGNYIYYFGNLPYYYGYENVRNTSGNIKIRIRVIPADANAPWSVLMDPVKVVKCA